MSPFTIWRGVVRIADCPLWDATLAAPFILMTCFNPLLWGVTLYLLVVAAFIIGGPGVLWLVSDLAAAFRTPRPPTITTELGALAVEIPRAITLDILLLAVLNTSWETHSPWLWVAALPWRVALVVRVLDLVFNVSALVVDGTLWVASRRRAR